MNLNFEWDPEKARMNHKKHKVSFEVASTIFLDPNALTIFDDTHSEFEDRWITMGISRNGSILIVVHTYQEETDNNAIVRIISVRKATKKEIKQYQGL